ncbi:MAG: GNAT family N-acetyltransferase [Gemmobacter sp.]|nr:GNAT family N-acetyltransferase [Gemmobacter sp.]
MIRELDPVTDRAAVEALFLVAADYIALETGLPVDGTQAADFFADAPPGIDPATSLRLGLFGPAGRLEGLAEVAFGYPAAGDAYIGLMLFAATARGTGHGARLLRGIEDRARQRGATRLLLAVLEANPKGRAFWQREGFAVEQSFPVAEMGLRRHIRHRMMKPL